MADEAIPPRQTLYVKNLDEKLHPSRLRELLYYSFSRYGSVLDVICVRNLKLRGQAWVVFEDVATATLAKSKLEGFTLNDKPIHINYAKTTSDVILKLKNPQEYRERLKRRREEAAKRKAEEKERMLEDPIEPVKKKPAQAAPAAPAPAAAPVRKPAQVSNEPPNKILFAQDLPDAVSVDKLNALFKPYPNFVEARLVPGRNMGFIEFADEVSAGAAKEALHNHKLDDKNISLTYAKR